MTITAEGESSSDSESTGLVVQHALSVDSSTRDMWIIDSGATCHLCNNEVTFRDLQALNSPLSVTLGEGQNLQAVGRGNVVLTMNLPQGKMENCTLHDVLLVPDLAYILLSVTSASKKGKVTTFSKMRCEIRNSKSKLIASGHREGSLYYLDHGGPRHQACPSSDRSTSKETIWHRRFGHLGVQGMQALARTKWSVGWTLTGNKSQVSVSPVSKERVTGCPSNSPLRKGQTIRLSWYTVMCVGRLEPNRLVGASTLSRSLMTTPDECGSIF